MYNYNCHIIIYNCYNSFCFITVLYVLHMFSNVIVYKKLSQTQKQYQST